MSHPSYLIAAISNSGQAPETSYRQLQNAAACPAAPYSEMFKLEVPSLMVGTLDSLMNLSDDLGKTDSLIENIVRKVEKSSIELGGKKATALTVGGVPSTRYIQQFAWDYAKFPNRRPLKELVSLISGGVAAIDEELKQLSNSYGEKQVALQDAKRRKGGNLLSADLNDVLNEQIVRGLNIQDTDYLKTVFVGVGKGQKEAFEKDIYGFGSELVGYGGPDWSNNPNGLGKGENFGNQVDRHRKKGSPVVPGSLTKVLEDKESALYTVTVLRSMYEAGYYEGEEFVQGTKIDLLEAFAKVLKEKRYVVRENFTYDPSQQGKSAMALEQLQVEVDNMRSGLTRWCKTHYGEAFVAWMHIKVIRVFVESVLRYGLPVDFTAVLYKVTNGKELLLVGALDKTFGEKKGKDDDMEDEEEYHDFVLIKFDP
mmetsp:Transcript_11952/g.21562  ORF Transcript_11952/g.21562 Transcript_11952/m.21562 type:complete len:425 (-) Transcript_11952:426-1700(-)|eukprot:CAMPEP_0201610082 /NCGR_PEP_ID=MMETSP0492-20130828/15728_1 /ASSEMBLY_ACC=CAM_ASM_000837 /TAXON_ID=420259 /ORGANISM="Thalassiosira gravida, Strain GMp14c1" /LENGTH=424 /DNA_ID=CAMNT_0048075763 /DNA_START=191 /DNA_END=1465 /DNA_ORIENTATION=+